jgi:uncharacterized protein
MTSPSSDFILRRPAIGIHSLLFMTTSTPESIPPPNIWSYPDTDDFSSWHSNQYIDLDNMDEKMVRVIGAATSYVQKYLSAFDASHDYSHVTRVLALVKLILKDENGLLPRPSTAPRGDKSKYLNQFDGPVNLSDLLTCRGADDQLARRVERLCQGVSYSTEIREPELIRHLTQEIPELAVVQDADRLDATDAIGIGRCFIFGASRGRGVTDSIRHVEEKLLRLDRMMKTSTDKAIARARTERMGEFLRWWDEETQVMAGGMAFYLEISNQTSESCSSLRYLTLLQRRRARERLPSLQALGLGPDSLSQG